MVRPPTRLRAPRLSTRFASCSPNLWISEASVGAASCAADYDGRCPCAKTAAMRSAERCRPTRSGSTRLDADARRVARRAADRRAIEQAARAGKLTARERLDLLLDPGSFVELDAFVTQPRRRRPTRVVPRRRRRHRTRRRSTVGLVFVFSQDFTVFGGSLSEAYAEKICKVMDLAMKVGAPIIGLNDSGGARIQEGVVSLGGYADIFLRNVLASGVVPQISVILGPCAGGAVYSPAITDFTVMVEGTSYMFVTGPDVVKTVTHEDVDAEFLGGAMTHTTRSGVAHLAAPDEASALDAARAHPGAPAAEQSGRRRPIVATDDPIGPDGRRARHVVPDDPRQPYDMHDVIDAIVDDGGFLEIQPGWAQNIIVGFARLGGRSVGIVAQQPAVLAGALDIDASIKAARFVRTCDASTSRCVTFVDVPGSCRASTRSTAGSSATARSCSTPTARRRSRR